MEPIVKSIHSVNHHHGWDNSLKPQCYVKSNDIIEVETIDSSGKQLNQKSDKTDLIKLDFDLVNPVTGPIFVEDAFYGDTVEIEFLEFNCSGWGWTGIIPGFGLLNDQFNEPFLNIWKYNKENPTNSLFSSFAKIPLNPFVGTIGVAPKEIGLHSVVPPRFFGGNLDIKELYKGTKLFLPVMVEGALISLGDTHAAQGDGEVCGTAIESPMSVLIKISLHKGQQLKSPIIETTKNANVNVNKEGSIITTGIGPDLFRSSQEAVMRMIDYLSTNYKLSSSNAYMLCSVAGNLKISEIVDVPNWVVSFEIPRGIML